MLNIVYITFPWLFHTGKHFVDFKFDMREFWASGPQLTPRCSKQTYVRSGRSTPYVGDGHLTFNDGIVIMGPYKPLRNKVDEFIPYHRETMGV